MANRLLLNVREMIRSDDETPVARVHHMPPPRFHKKPAESTFETTGYTETTEYTQSESTAASEPSPPKFDVEAPVFSRDYWQNHMVNISEANASSLGIVTLYEMDEVQGNASGDPFQAI